MLVQALAEYADHHLGAQLNDAAWEEKPVPWALEVSRQGAFLTVVPRMTSVARGKKTSRGSHADERAALAGEPE
jgi:hypothetical protein